MKKITFIFALIWGALGICLAVPPMKNPAWLAAMNRKAVAVAPVSPMPTDGLTAWVDAANFTSSSGVMVKGNYASGLPTYTNYMSSNNSASFTTFGGQPAYYYLNDGTGYFSTDGDPNFVWYAPGQFSGTFAFKIANDGINFYDGAYDGAGMYSPFIGVNDQMATDILFFRQGGFNAAIPLVYYNGAPYLDYNYEYGLGNNPFTGMADQNVVGDGAYHWYVVRWEGTVDSTSPIGATTTFTVTRDGFTAVNSFFCDPSYFYPVGVDMSDPVGNWGVNYSLTIGNPSTPNPTYEQNYLRYYGSWNRRLTDAEVQTLISN